MKFNQTTTIPCDLQIKTLALVPPIIINIFCTTPVSAQILVATSEVPQSGILLSQQMDPEVTPDYPVNPSCDRLDADRFIIKYDYNTTYRVLCHNSTMEKKTCQIDLLKMEKQGRAPIFFFSVYYCEKLDESFKICPARTKASKILLTSILPELNTAIEEYCYK